ncbi:MAG: hypothetical protein ACREJM_09105, partial [Candidatus Saccharimonadales bacterium]
MGVILTYATVDDAAGIDRQRVLDVVRRRVSLWATAKLRDDGHIEIGVYGADRANVERVRGRLAAMGELEFRIVADDRFDAELIETANDPVQTPKENVFTTASNGKRTLAAQWCAVAADELRFLQHGHKAIRQDASGSPQALVLIDRWNVTGADLASATPGQDGNGRPCVNFALSSDGAR